MKYTLYYSAWCPYCIRVLSHLTAKSYDDVILCDVADKENKQALLQGGGKTQVPCLKVVDKKNNISWLYESADIIRYLDDAIC